MSAVIDIKDQLFKDAKSLPSLVCRKRYLDAMLTIRDMKSDHSDLAKRIAPEDKSRLIRDRLFLLKQCMIKEADDAKKPYLYNLASH